MNSAFIKSEHEDRTAQEKRCAAAGRIVRAGAGQVEAQSSGRTTTRSFEWEAKSGRGDGGGRDTRASNRGLSRRPLRGSRRSKWRRRPRRVPTRRGSRPRRSRKISERRAQDHHKPRQRNRHGQHSADAASRNGRCNDTDRTENPSRAPIHSAPPEPNEQNHRPATRGRPIPRWPRCGGRSPLPLGRSRSASAKRAEARPARVSGRHPARGTFGAPCLPRHPTASPRNRPPSIHEKQPTREGFGQARPNVRRAGVGSGRGRERVASSSVCKRSRAIIRQSRGCVRERKSGKYPVMDCFALLQEVNIESMTPTRRCPLAGGIDRRSANSSR